MGRYWLGSLLLPFPLYIGVIVASFQEAGMSEFFKDFLIMVFSGSNSVSAHLWRTIAGTESGPGAELILVDFIATVITNFQRIDFFLIV